MLVQLVELPFFSGKQEHSAAHGEVPAGVGEAQHDRGSHGRSIMRFVEAMVWFLYCNKSARGS